ncbi:hypothetical protein DVH24_010132 [Malus domestica]|uniref:Uncharacterized protein n=1 Tax=Malus domestica TaxID=3750 RepID=A0A498JS99_MALDO|nr:hypothetical protein DVH24_010132 [Malus domestica]
MIMRVPGLCFLAKKVLMNQHGGHLTLMMTLTRCGVSMQLVPPSTGLSTKYGETEFPDFSFGSLIWIRRVIRITTFLALGSSASTLSGLGHHKEVAFRRRAALLHSVPSTPLSAFNSGYSPPRYKDSSESSFDTFSRFDSFRSTQDTGFFPQPETLGRFDSMRSSRDFDQGHGFPTFDDILDLFGSSAPFRSSLDSQTPTRDSNPFGSSGPFRMALGSQTPRRESDFFGSSAVPFRTSFDSQTPRGDSDAFGSSPFRTSFDGQTLRRNSDPYVGLQGLSGPEENGAIQGIVKMEQEGDGDGTLQDRVDRIQLDLDGLVKTLNERCKKYGLRGKPTTLTELPFDKLATWHPRSC